MEDPSWINAAGRPASLGQTPQHCFSIGRHRGPSAGRAVVCGWANTAHVAGPGLVAGGFVIVPRPEPRPSRPARRLPW